MALLFNNVGNPDVLLQNIGEKLTVGVETSRNINTYDNCCWNVTSARLQSGFDIDPNHDVKGGGRSQSSGLNVTPAQQDNSEPHDSYNQRTDRIGVHLIVPHRE